MGRVRRALSTAEAASNWVTVLTADMLTSKFGLSSSTHPSRDFEFRKGL